MRSAPSSMPVDMRMRSSGRPRAARTSAGMEAWLMKQGRLIWDVTLPKETVTLNRVAASTTALLASRLHPGLVIFQSQKKQYSAHLLPDGDATGMYIFRDYLLNCISCVGECRIEEDTVVEKCPRYFAWLRS